jgi:hypothetical protein
MPTGERRRAGRKTSKRNCRGLSRRLVWNIVTVTNWQRQPGREWTGTRAGQGLEVDAMIAVEAMPRVRR